MSGAVSNPTVFQTGVSNGANSPTPRTNSFQLTLATGVAQIIDFRAMQNLNQIQDIQGIFIDNSANATAFTITAASGQNLVCPPNSQMTHPFYLPAATPVSTCSGNGVVNIVMNNFATPAAVWSASASSLPVVGGLVQTQDVALDGIINPILNALQVYPSAYGNLDTPTPTRSGNKMYAGVAAAGTSTVIITGASAAFFTSLKILLDPNSTITGGATYTVSIEDTSGPTVLATTTIYVGATAPTNTQSAFVVLDLNQVTYTTTANLEVVISGSALTTGNFRYIVFGGQTAF